MKTGNETFELIELIETTLRSPKLESTSDRILHAISKILRSSTSFLYLNDKRLPVSQFVLKGLQSEIQADMEKLCRELFDTMSDQTDIVPVNLSSCQATEKAGNLMVFPLRTKEISIGLIGLIVDEDTTSTNFIERLLRTITCVIDIHIERAKAERELSNMNKYLTVSSMLTHSFDLHELLGITLSCCMEAVSAEAASILLLDDKKKNFYFYEITGSAKDVNDLLVHGLRALSTRIFQMTEKAEVKYSGLNIERFSVVFFIGIAAHPLYRYFSRRRQFEMEVLPR